MNKINKNHIGWSLLLCFLVPLFIPSALSTEGKESYVYGLPLEYVTIYQQSPNSGWFFDNFFNGNAGLLINPGTFAINVIIVYLIISFISSRFHKKNGSI